MKYIPCMRYSVLPAILAFSCIFAHGQIQRTITPMGDAIDKAQAKILLIDGDSKPFHLRLAISEPENPQSPYRGVIEEWWLSSQQWRREVTGNDGLRQTIVVVAGKKTEKDEGDYFPLWLRNFETALFDPIPNAAMWKSSKAPLVQTALPNGDKSEPCARGQEKIGVGAQVTTVFFDLCFDAKMRVANVVGPQYSMEFSDYRPFGKKEVARKLVSNPEPGTRIVGILEVLEGLSAEKMAAKNLLTPLDTNDNRFHSVSVSTAQLEQLSIGNPPIVWPTVRSGKIHGNLAMYISADSQGRVREAWPLNSDNAGLDDSAREQVRSWKLKPAADKSGKRVQVDGALGFAFNTSIANPLPVVTGSEIGKYATGCAYQPVLPTGLLPSGESFKIRASVNEAGEETGESFPAEVPWNVIQKAGINFRNCHFRKYLVNGQPVYYFIDFVFTAP